MDSTTAPSTRFNFLLPPPTSIENLPPEMLTIVLKDEKIPFSQRFDLRAVSSHWQEVIEEHVFKTTTTKLLLSNAKYDVHRFNRLPIKVELFPLLARLFPALADLEVHFDRAVYQLLPPLLTAFSTTLTTLGLWHDREEEENEPSTTVDQWWLSNLATAINSLTALTSLDLDIHPNSSAILPQLLPTLGRLQRFNYADWEMEPARAWSKLTTNQPLTRMIYLELGSLCTADYTATVLDITTIFPSLQSLHLNVESDEPEHIRLIDIFRSLSSLKHLSELAIDYLHYSPNQQYLPSRVDQRLTSVKKLHLIFENNAAISSELLTSLVVNWFPSVEELYLSCWRHFQLTTTTLRNLACLKQLKKLSLGREWYLKADELVIESTDRPLTSLKWLHLKIDAVNYPAKPFCSSALVGWFPCLVELSLKFPSNLPLSTAILRDLSHLEHLSKLELQLLGVQFKPDQLHLPTSSDRRLVSVKKLGLTIYQKPDNVDGERYLCTALAAWFPFLEQLNIPQFSRDDREKVFIPTFPMLSQLATLKHLTELNLSEMKFTKEHFHFPLPTSADSVLANLKKLNVQFDAWSGHECSPHFISVLIAWCPNLEKLAIGSAPLKLTSLLLRQLGRLGRLPSELQLPRILYEKKHLEVFSSSTDRPLNCLKELKLNMVEPLENFDSWYFCSTLARWCPHLEKIIIHLRPISRLHSVERDRHTAYKMAIKANCHYFDRDVELVSVFDF